MLEEIMSSTRSLLQHITHETYYPTSVWAQLIVRELDVYTRNIIFICVVLEPPKKYINFFTSLSQAFTLPKVPLQYKFERRVKIL